MPKAEPVRLFAEYMSVSVQTPYRNWPRGSTDYKSHFTVLGGVELTYVPEPHRLKLD
jgi:hypothetical protein